MAKSDNNQSVEQLVAKAFAHPLRIQILIILNERAASPNQLSQELGRSLNLIAYHVRVLEKYGCARLVDTKQRRGATEHFYRAIRHQLLSDSEWARMPEALRPGISAAMLKSVFADVDEAVAAGTLDADSDRHLSRTALRLDRRGWKEMVALLSEMVERALTIQATAGERLAASGEEPIDSKLEVLHFRSPRPGEGGAKE